MYKLDRTAFKMQKAEEKNSTASFWKTKAVEERLRAAMYLNSVAYNFDVNNPPRMDRTAYSQRKRP